MKEERRKEIKVKHGGRKKKMEENTEKTTRGWPRYNQERERRAQILLNEPTGFKEKIHICSYNTLAKQYCRESLYKDYDASFLDWNSRKKKIVSFISELDADIFSLQV